MAMDGFMRSVNTGEKCLKEQKEATAVLICENKKQQTQQKFRDPLEILSALGKTWELFVKFKSGNRQEKHR